MVGVGPVPRRLPTNLGDVQKGEAHERWRRTSWRKGGQFRVTIPGAYTGSAYPLIYFSELRVADGNTWLYPGLNEDLANEPYFVVRQAIG